MNLFNMAGKKERELTTKLFNKLGINYEFTDEFGFSRHDVCFTNVYGISCVAEVKVRRYTSNFYQEWIIEKAKYNYLINKDMPSFYINFYEDGTARIWNLRKQKIDWSDRDMPRTTMGDNERILKSIGMLKNEYGKVIKL